MAGDGGYVGLGRELRELGGEEEGSEGLVWGQYGWEGVGREEDEPEFKRKVDVPAGGLAGSERGERRERTTSHAT